MRGEGCGVEWCGVVWWLTGDVGSAAMTHHPRNVDRVPQHIDIGLDKRSKYVTRVVFHLSEQWRKH